MESLFCCDAAKPYRPQYLLHQARFTEFLDWAKFPRSAAPDSGHETKPDLTELEPPYAVQLVRQVNYGPLESKRYFIPVSDKDDFIEVTEDDLIQANFKKLNS